VIGRKGPRNAPFPNLDAHSAGLGHQPYVPSVTTLGLRVQSSRFSHGLMPHGERQGLARSLKRLLVCPLVHLNTSYSG